MLWILAAGGLNPYPLTESQLARLETADDGSATIDEAALYALLENAADTSATEAGAVVPDYDALRREPQAWRGTRCLIEGTLYRVMEPDLAREGWDGVEGAVVRIDHSRETPRAEDFIIVYLTDPPQWDWRIEKEGVVWPARVRLVGRFFKVSSYTTQGARGKPPHEAAYLTFVGRSIGQLETQRAPTELSWKAPALLVLVLAAIAVLVWRLKATGGGRRATHLQDYLEQRQAQRAIRGESEDEESDEPILPDNPAEALDTLADKRRLEEE